MNNTFKSIAFGCRVNEAEKVVMDRELTAAGFVQDETKPNLILINSCCVTGKAEREMRQSVYQLRRNNPDATIVVTGCAATRWLRDGENIDGATLLVGNDQKRNILPLITTITGDMTPEGETSSASDKFTDSGRLMIKIQDGCHRFCSYCIVPYMRGKPVSKSIKDIVSEINTSGADVQEATLTAINTEAFGKDSGEPLIQLIDAILTKTHVPRLSFGSIHPWSITDEFLRYYKSIATSKRFVHFFHIPIQSGSDSVLQRMNRQYHTMPLQSSLSAIKDINPDAFIGTVDVIVGFPGETEKEFDETYGFLSNSPIDRFHVFRYSVRPGTAAERMIDTFPEPTPSQKGHRSETLRTLSDEHFLSYRKRMTGKQTSVLLLKSGTDTLRDGLTDTGIAITVSGKNLRSASIVHATITGKNDTGFTGTEV